MPRSAGPSEAHHFLSFIHTRLYGQLVHISYNIFENVMYMEVEV